MSVLIDCSLTNFHELSKFWRPSGGLRVSDMQERETERKGLLFGHRNRWEEWREKEGQRGVAAVRVFSGCHWKTLR